MTDEPQRKHNAIDVDVVVREVLARLNREAGQSGQQSPPIGDKPQLSDTATQEAMISSRVVTLAELEGRLAGVRRLIVPAGAVVTPAARDRLREWNVSLSYSTPRAKNDACGPALVFAAVQTNYDPTSLVRSLLRTGIVVEQIARTGLVNVIAEMTEHVAKGGKQAVVLSSEPAAAVCLANRRRSVRAVTGSDAASIERAIASVGANVLIVDPRGRPLAPLARTIERYVTGGPRSCPAELAQALGSIAMRSSRLSTPD